jgi:hypothetical protein
MSISLVFIIVISILFILIALGSPIFVSLGYLG